MPPSYTEWKQRSGESVGTVHNPSFETALGMIKTAAVSFEHLTNDPHWDRFLSHVQDRLAIAKRDQSMWLEVCAAASEEQEIRKAQLNYHLMTGKVHAYEEMLILPHQVMEEYKKVS